MRAQRVQCPCNVVAFVVAPPPSSPPLANAVGKVRVDGLPMQHSVLVGLAAGKGVGDASRAGARSIGPLPPALAPLALQLTTLSVDLVRE